MIYLAPGTVLLNFYHYKIIFIGPITLQKIAAMRRSLVLVVTSGLV